MRQRVRLVRWYHPAASGGSSCATGESGTGEDERLLRVIAAAPPTIV